MRERHGESSRRSGITPEYRAWKSMLSRCYIDSASHFNDYGGRGISVCSNWRTSYQAFLDHIGLRPTPKHELDRIDNDGNYEPGNVRWATRLEQAGNRRNVQVYDFDGRRCGLGEWARITGVGIRTLRHRLLAGWSVERTLSTPVLSPSEARATKLTTGGAREIKLAINRGEPYARIAERHGVSLTMIDKIVSGECWRDA